MGNTNKKNQIYNDVISLTYQKISKSANPKVLSLYIDNAQYPESGMIAVGNECIFPKNP